MSNLIEEKEELFISIAKSKNLRYYKHNSKNKVQFFQIYPIEAKKIFIALNQQITNDLGEDYQIGHSYFIRIKNDDDLDFILEYFCGDKDGLEKVLKIVEEKEKIE